MPREKVPNKPRIMERIVRINSKERIAEELSIFSVKPFSFNDALALETFLFLDFLSCFKARLCLTCRSCGLILEVNPIPAMAKVKTIVSVMLGGIAQK